MNKTHIIKLEKIIDNKTQKKMESIIKSKYSFNNIIIRLNKNFKIEATTNQKEIINYSRDWSNMDGNAQALIKPKSEFECAIILYLFNSLNIPITISAGRTNLTGSATPKGGIILTTEKLISSKINVDLENQTVSSPIGIYLEKMREEVLKQSSNKLIYPVDPTSREEAFVGGTISCNASGFVPGEQGATRFWVKEINFLFLNGFKIKIKRGDFISKKGIFIIKYPDGTCKELPVLTYNYPQIKNASGPFSDPNGKVDFIDLIIGSEGIFGMITKTKFKLKRKPKLNLDLFIPIKNENLAIKLYFYLTKILKNNFNQLTALEYFGYNSKKYMNHKEKLFINDNEVGIYIQIPVCDKSFEDSIEQWFMYLSESGCEIDLDSVLHLNNAKNWETFFQARHSLPANALSKVKQLNSISILTDTIVPPEKFKEYLKLCHKVLNESKIEYLLFGHLGDCHLHFHLIPTNEQQEKAIIVYNQLVKYSSQLGGVYSAEHGTGKRKRSDFIDCFGYKAVRQVKNCKKVFDPKFLLNRGNIIDFKN